MFTSRAEYRLWLRADNADERLYDLGMQSGVIGTKRQEKWQAHYQKLQMGREILSNISLTPHQIQQFGIKTNQDGKKRTAEEWLSISKIPFEKFIDFLSIENESCQKLKTLPTKIKNQLEIDALYINYVKRQNEDMLIYQRDQGLKLPKNLNYQEVSGLSLELRQKLSEKNPASLADAAKISGITPAALLLLLRYIKKNKKHAA